MTITEVQEATKVLIELLTKMVRDFEVATGCIVHSIPVVPASENVGAIVKVKVQIP